MGHSHDHSSANRPWTPRRLPASGRWTQVWRHQRKDDHTNDHEAANPGHDRAPQIIKEFGLSTLQVGFLNAVPPTVAVIAMVLWACAAAIGLKSGRAGSGGEQTLPAFEQRRPRASTSRQSGRPHRRSRANRRTRRCWASLIQINGPFWSLPTHREYEATRRTLPGR